MATTNSRSQMRLLIGITGSVATIKLPELLHCLSINYPDIDIKIIATKPSLNFVNLKELLPIKVYSDDDDWTNWKQKGDPVLHIQLRDWADAIVIAPLDANTLAKLAAGICDNLLTCVLRAWDYSKDKPILICPAMNTAMWNHPFTAKHLNSLKIDLGFQMLLPMSKQLACGDIGIGAMAEVSEIAIAIDSLFKK